MCAFIAIEDKRFYKHHGVDWGSTVKAAALRVKGGSITRGGSTITQQLVRNVFSEKIGFDKSYTRKFKEILTALFLERKYSKKQILEYYINNINFANNYYGIGAASYGYFGKSVDELSETEIAFLCAIPNNPTYYNPRTNMDHTIKRRNIILKEMYDQGYLKRAEYLKAVNVKVTLVPEANDFYNYESSFAVKCATESLMKSAGFHFRYNFDSQPDYDNYQEEYADAYKDAEHLLYTGGFSVYTTLDLSVQNSAQKALDKELKDFKSKDKNGIYNMQGAATVIDNSTGKVIACVGGRSQNSSYYSLNRAFQAYQQPGSTIKPLIVYTPALQKGSQDAYNKFSKKLSDTDSRYQISMTHTHDVVYPEFNENGNAIKGTKTIASTKYEDDILDELYDSKGIYYLEKGDKFSVTVKNTTRTMGQKLNSIFTGSSTKYAIVATYGGVIRNENY